LFLTVAGALVLAVPAAAEGPVQVSLGYSFVKYLETDAGSAPLGAFLALSGRKALTPELDLGWQREDGGTLTTFTAVAGPRFAFASAGAVKPFVHVLGGLRHDRIGGHSNLAEWESPEPTNTAWGGLAGGGVDIKAGERLAVRLGADFQIFFDQGDNLKTLRLSVGLTF
jgi:hypothetical protein